MAGRPIKGSCSIALVIAAQTTACSTTAAITRFGGPDMEVRITGGSANAVVVKAEGDLSYAVGRGDIREVDHPGNVVATVGGVLSVYGLLNIATGLDRCRDDAHYSNDVEQGAFCTGLFAPAVIGTGMLAWGLHVYLRSKHALEDTSLPASTVAGLPAPYYWPQLTPAMPGPHPPRLPPPLPPPTQQQTPTAPSTQQQAPAAPPTQQQTPAAPPQAPVAPPPEPTPPSANPASSSK